MQPLKRSLSGEILLRVRLVKKLAQFLNGVDLRNLTVGQCVDLPDTAARMLVSAGWAVLPDAPIDRCEGDS